MEQKTFSGNIRISDEAIAAIVAIAAKSVDGVIDMDSGTVGGIAEILGIKYLNKGVKVDLKGDTVSVDVNIIIAFGRDIIETSAEAQEKIRESIEQMSGLIVDKINLTVTGVRPASEKKKT